MTSRLTWIEAAVLLICSVGLVSGALALPDCSSEVSQLSPCLTFISGQVTNPAQSCCDALKSAVATEPICLCELLGYGGNLSLPSGYNITLAAELPSLCNLAVNQTDCPALINGAPSSSPLPSGGVPGGPGSPNDNGASRKIPGLISTIVRFAAAPALVSLLLRVYFQT